MPRVTKRLHYTADTVITQVLRWKSVVRKHLDGTETRAALLTKPRETYQLNYRLGDTDMVRLAADLYNYTDEDLWLVPQWWDPHVVTSASSSNINLVSIATDIIAGQWVYVEQDDGTPGEFIQSNTVGTTLVTTVGALSTTYTAGARMYPARLVQLAQDNSAGSRYPVELTDLQISVITQDFYPLGGSGSTLNSLDSLTLLEPDPLGDSPREIYNRGLVFFDKATPPGVASWRAQADILRPRSYLATTRGELQWWKAFLDQRLGDCVPFLASTGTPDLILYEQPATGSATIKVDITDTDFDAEWFGSGNTAHKHLQLVDTQVTWEATISSVLDNGDGTMTITFTPALPGIPLTITRVSFLERCRLEGNEVTISHSPTSSRIDLVLRTVQEE